MNDLIKAELELEEPTEFHKKLLSHVKGLVDTSRKQMTTYYEEWDHNDEIYRGVLQANKSDAKAEERGEPTRMVVPMAYAQVQTFVAFCMSLFLQRERVFELVGRGTEDTRAAKIGEALLARDLNVNVFESKLYQFLLDVARFGLGVFKLRWVRETTEELMMVEQPPVSLFGQPLGGQNFAEVLQQQTKYLGNRIMNISPYRFFPDVRLPLSRFQEGEFVASEDEYSIATLKQMEVDGEIAGTQWIKPFNKNDYDSRGVMSRLSRNMPVDDATMVSAASQSVGMAILTEVQVTLIPSQFEIDGKPMGDSVVPEKWVVWYVNDKRVVKAEPLGYNHGMFTYDVGEYSPDMHKLVNEGLSTTIDNLQNVITWMINSHITSVRKTIQNWLVVDPSGIEMKDLVERRPVIRLRPDAARQGVDKYVKQLAVSDVTANHMKDADALHGLVQIVTGINDNALGQFYTGRRSATEARNVNSASAARLKMPALLLFRNSLEPMARKMLSNLRQGLDEETYVRVIGEENIDAQAFEQFARVTRMDLVGEYDFEVFDGTLPSERAQQADAIGEFLLALLKTPDVAVMLGYDPRKLMDEWLELKGIRNPARFKLEQLRQMELTQQLQMFGYGGTAGSNGNGVSEGAEAGVSAGGAGVLGQFAGFGRRPGLQTPQRSGLAGGAGNA